MRSLRWTEPKDTLPKFINCAIWHRTTFPLSNHKSQQIILRAWESSLVRISAVWEWLNSWTCLPSRWKGNFWWRQCMDTAVLKRILCKSIRAMSFIRDISERMPDGWTGWTGLVGISNMETSESSRYECRLLSVLGRGSASEIHIFSTAPHVT